MPSHIRDARNQTAHDNKIRLLAEQYAKDGYSVKTEHIDGFEKPALIGGQAPDLVASRGNEMILVEVETECSLDTNEARMERIAFSGYAALDSDNRRFQIIIV